MLSLLKKIFSWVYKFFKKLIAKKINRPFPPFVRFKNEKSKWKQRKVPEVVLGSQANQ
jgi:hypothetical protein